MSDMTNKINMAELLADRKAGTDRFTFDHDWSRLPTIFDADGEKVATIEKSGFPNRSDHTERQAANASRIARLPDLEAAYIEAVKALEKLTEAADSASDFINTNIMDDAIVSARTALEKIHAE